MKDKREDLRLEYVKKGLVNDRNEQLDLKDAIIFRGDCLDMCPEYERHMREYMRKLHIYEMVEGTENDQFPRADPERMVKAYERSGAGKDAPLPCDVRPIPVLVVSL